MTEPVRTLLRRKAVRAAVPAVAAALVAALAGCGAEVPANAVATVEGETIEKTQFDHWLNAAARGQPRAPGPPPVVPDPPDFQRCVAARQGQLPKGARPPSPAALKDQCKREYEELKRQVMQFLISSTWIQKEAERRQVNPSEAEVRKQFDDQKRQEFQNNQRAYESFLRTSGQTEQDLLFRVRLDVLTNQIRDKVLAEKVNEQSLRAEFDRNRQRFAQPEQRDLEVIFAKNEAKGRQARKAAEDDFPKAVKRFSTETPTKRSGGKLPGYRRGEQGPPGRALDDAVFAAKRGELVGPIRSPFGFAVFRVTKITPPAQGDFEQAKQQLRAQLEQQALNDFVADFTKRNKAQTACARDFVIEDCKNSPPPPKGAPAPPGAGAPPGGQGAPPGGQGAPPGAGTPPP